MRKYILLIGLYLVGLTLSAQVSKTVNITSGGLKAALTSTELHTVTNLSITGTIDARDFKTMRDSITKLSVLDISNVTIATYTGTEGTSGSIFYTYYSANEIPISAFRIIYSDQNPGLTSIKMPNSVTSIGPAAFYNCSGLTSITIPNSVTSIEINAFANCDNLTSIIMPNSLTSIGQGAFNSCSGLTSIIIPDSLTSIGSNAFGNCTGLTSITIPNSVTSIGDKAFYSCIGLTSITIPASVTSIEHYSLGLCSGLTAIYVYKPTPVDLSSIFGVFYGVNISTCKLYVPIGSKSLYQAANQWKDFTNIAEFVTAVPRVSDDVSVQIYPNPVKNGFYINWLEGDAMLYITDLNGRTMLKKKVTKTIYIPVQSLTKGIYNVNLVNERINIKQKIIIQ